MRPGSPYFRATQCALAIAAAMSLPPAERALALLAVKPYKSRGKGRGTPARNYHKPTHNARPAHEGEQERLRRSLGGWAAYKRLTGETKEQTLRPRPRIVLGGEFPRTVKYDAS